MPNENQKNTGVGDSMILSEKEMRNIIKKKQTSILHLNGSIKKKRQEMRNLSDEVTKLIERKIIFPHSSERGNYFYPNADDKELSDLYQQRDKVFKEAQQIRQQISHIKAAQEPEIVEQIKKKRSMMEKLVREYIKNFKEKLLLQEEMEKNKGRLHELQNSSCLKDIQETTKELEAIKKEIKQIDKDCYEMMNEDIQYNMFIFEVKEKINKQQQPVNPDQRPVNKQQVDEIVEELQDIFEERKLLQRSHSAKLYDLQKEGQELIRQNSELSARIRIIKNNLLQKDLQIKRFKNKSTSNIIKKPLEQKQAIKHYQSQALQKEKEKEKEDYLDISKNLLQPPKTNAIIMGKWNNQSYIKDDVVDDPTIQRAISMKIRTKQQRITGIGVTYIDHMGVQIFGRGNIWKNKINEKEKQININLQEISQLQYNTNAKNQLGLKWIYSNGKQIKVGTFDDKFQKISLQAYSIRSAEFCLQENYIQIMGIKLIIQQNIVRPKKNNLSIKSYSVADIGLKKRKVILKSPQKLNNLPQVDHRLMLNRKKKMV